MQIGVELARTIENRRILVVMQDEILRAALQFMLHDEYEAHEVADPAAALKKAARSPVDLVLLDMAFVWAEGTAVLSRLREALAGSDGRIVLVAESADDPDAHACLHLADGILGKPLEIAAVRRVVARRLSRPRVVREAA